MSKMWPEHLSLVACFDELLHALVYQRWFDLLQLRIIISRSREKPELLH